MIEFAPFSMRQQAILTWWINHPEMNGIIADGSIRSGKSVSMSISFIMWAMQTFNDTKFAMCGKTVGSLRRNVVNDLVAFLERHDFSVIDKRGACMLVVTKGKHTNYFYMFSGNDERSQDAIQGITLAGVLFDEVALMPESFVNQATGRCSIAGSKLWFNCNPAGSRYHWFKVNWIDMIQKKKLIYVHFTMNDNLSLSEEVKSRYESMYSGVFYRRYIEGRWVAAEGAIYDMWELKENSYDETPDIVAELNKARRFVSIDYGTANPMVFLDAMDDGVNFWIRKEYYYDSRKDMTRGSKTDSEYADDFEEFVDHDHALTVIIDPSALSFKTELKNRGYRVRDAKNDVLDGIRLTAAFIKKRRLKVCRGKCPNFEREIESYVWDAKSIERGDEAPLKENDHAMDAMRYLVKTVANKWRISM